MFTGIVSSVGTLLERKRAAFLIACPYKREASKRGVDRLRRLLLTIVGVSKAQGRARCSPSRPPTRPWRAPRSAAWQEGRRINLERPLTLGDELGGHLVTGHIDGRARILARDQDGDSIRFVLEDPAALARFIAGKGAVALDGVSLTVNDVDGTRFGVNIIPYTLAHTTWQDRRPSDLVNLEVDLLARYVARLKEQEGLTP
jgi:riboflavin synthase